MNASDARGKADKDVGKGMGGSTSNQVKELITNRSVSGSGKKIALIMDEVDGMSGGDRGGVQDLIQSIQKSKIPIICTCNDKYNQKIKSLVGHCMELNFEKPSKQQIARRLGEVAGKEGMHVEEVRGFGVYGAVSGMFASLSGYRRSSRGLRSVFMRMGEVLCVRLYNIVLDN